jgi:hypothetical protein
MTFTGTFFHFSVLLYFAFKSSSESIPTDVPLTATIDIDVDRHEFRPLHSLLH